jgi:hypothetical protein
MKMDRASNVTEVIQPCRKVTWSNQHAEIKANTGWRAIDGGWPIGESISRLHGLFGHAAVQWSSGVMGLTN